MCIFEPDLLGDIHNELKHIQNSKECDALIVLLK